MPQVPNDVAQVLIHLAFENLTSHSSSHVHHSAHMVPFAALLLEYPVGYVLTSVDQTSFLSRVSLDVYECMIACDEPPSIQKHVLLKFSCPTSIGLQHPQLSVTSLTEGLRRRFGSRLERMGSGFRLEVHVRTEILDRVAL